MQLPLTNPESGPKFTPSLLRDAYLCFDEVAPHHSLTFGQMQPPAGEEAWRDSGLLDFVERSMIGSMGDLRDIGAMVHGAWFKNRLQYWVGVFNGPDGTVLMDPNTNEGGNRAADRESKDLAWRIAAWPLWQPSRWYGCLELGYARTDGWRGTAAKLNRTNPANDFITPRTAINRQSAWAWYTPGAAAAGWWLAGRMGLRAWPLQLYQRADQPVGNRHLLWL